MAMRVGGSLMRAMAWATHPYLVLVLVIGGLVVAAGPHAVESRGEGHGSGRPGVAIEDAPPGRGWRQGQARAKRHRDACVNCRRIYEDGRRRRGLAPTPG
jgi:hypothetical protein